MRENNRENNREKTIERTTEKTTTTHNPVPPGHIPVLSGRVKRSLYRPVSNNDEEWMNDVSTK